MIENGFINIIKPTGMSSSDVVCRVKKALKLKKVGHLGTLDPAASGVLPIAFGKATKFFDYFLKKDKEYIADVKFGILTDTLDSFGLITDKQDVLIKKEDILGVLPKFIGEIEQVPPMYSAIKINGKKACDIARSGDFVELKARQIEIFSIEILDELDKNFFRFKVHCSAGTYIRTLFNDIANCLNTVATTSVIIRTKSGAFKIDGAVTIDEISYDACKSIESVFSDINVIEVTDKNVIKKLANGVKITKNEFGFGGENHFILTCNEGLIGMYHYEEDKLICDVFLMNL